MIKVRLFKKMVRRHNNLVQQNYHKLSVHRFKGLTCTWFPKYLMVLHQVSSVTWTTTFFP